MDYNFDEIIDRTGTNAMVVHGYEGYLFNEEEAQQIPFKGKELLSMWVADMDFSVAPPIVAAIKNRLDQGILGYTAAFEEAYFEAIIQWGKKQYDHVFKKEHILASNGVIPALYTLVEILTHADEKVLFLTPSYAFFQHAADHNDRQWVASPLVLEDGKFFIDFEDLQEKLADPKVRLMIFCNPHNPTGRVWTEVELQKVGQLCLDHDVVLISDEIHCDLLRVGKAFTPMAKVFPNSDQIITCMSASKTFNLAGLMNAHIIVPNDDIRERWNDRVLPISNPLSLVGTQAAFNEGQDWLDQLKIYLDSNFAYLDTFLKENLPKAVFALPEATYLAWIDLGAYFPSEENLTLFFAKEVGLLLEGANMFVDNGEGFVRMNIACPREKLVEGLTRMKKALLK